MSVGGSKLRPKEYHSVVVANRMRRHLVFGSLVIKVEFFFGRRVNCPFGVSVGGSEPRPEEYHSVVVANQHHSAQALCHAGTFL